MLSKTKYFGKNFNDFGSSYVFGSPNSETSYIRMDSCEDGIKFAEKTNDQNATYISPY